MCGILAYLNYDDVPVDGDLLVRMRDTMDHRGPDGVGIHLDGRVGLAHRRLAIIDLTDCGKQPMENEDGTIFLVVNGEIYNYLELMSGLIKNGHRFRSKTDSEVIIHQYEEDGEGCVRKFNGMFSFVLWDTRQRKMFAARDRFGIKPLYYYHDDDKIIFSSEIKAIVEDPTVRWAPNPKAIADYFFAERSLGTKTVFSGISEVEPGHMILVDQTPRRVRSAKYWDLTYRYNGHRKENAVLEELAHLLDDSVKIHCRSDAPLGCHLSGGLDSSIVVALAARHRERMKTFSIKFSDDDYIDETRYAKAVANHVGAEYLESRPTAEDMANVLPLLIWHMDYPMATEGGFSYYTVSRLANRHVKVSLTGHGGDEIFAGYPGQFKMAYGNTDMFMDWKDPFRIQSPTMFRKIYKALTEKSLTGLTRSLVNKIMPKEPSFNDLWIQLHCGLMPGENPIFEEGFLRSLEGYSPRDEYLKPFDLADTDELLDKCLYHDLRSYLPGLLHLEDRVSMAMSIESRIPFLDYRIVEFLATIPPNQKVKNLRPKYLLRRVGSSLLPEEVWNREDKFPFPVPGKFWLTKEMQALVKEVLLDPASIKRGIFRQKVLKEASEGRDKGLLWALVNCELWYKIFVDRRSDWLGVVDRQRAFLRSN